MQQTIKRTELKEALEIVKPGLASKEIIEQSTSSDTFKYFNLTRLFSFMYKDVYLNFKKNEKNIIR